MSKKLTLLLAVLALLASVLACSAASSDSPPPADNPPQQEPPQQEPPQQEPPQPPAADSRFSNARMAFDEGGDQPTEVFSPSDDFYLVFDIKDGRQGEVLSTKWYGEENPGDGPTYMFYEQTFPLESDVASSEIYFNLFNTENDWPVGEYKVEMFSDGTLVLTKYFSVQ